ncbi:D-arabinono-1,4-lactone oxidase [Actinophytocola gossypii]|uniref:FAD-binding protein n=1 Tax=Actinophytocola gossypii TaxID=2812003 RepID=A0ABT2JA18_9PSEU|nr:D-arabinono-1,4-lactone oxidase [Actinophytocola gossypii]MCT2584305.1 FAD-binding protein [Actinophytocola gossypii]
MERNWAGNLTYRASRIARPRTEAELRELVAGTPRIRALGSRHSFSDVADTPDVLVSLDALPGDVEVAGDRVTVPAATRYGDLAEVLRARGLALPNLASLPHISVAGAVATGTHGSGDRNGCLSTSVAALDVVGADGEPRRVLRGDPEFAGSVVALGALGVVVRVVLDVVPAFDVRQTVYPEVPWPSGMAELDALMSAGYSVSLFTDWTGDHLRQVWVKSTTTAPPADLFGAGPATAPLHMIPTESVDAVTEQLGAPGPWLDRLPHFRMTHKPSSGEELQSEYLVPREAAPEAIARVRAMAGRVSPVLHVTEIRSVAADDLWLSGAHGRDSIAVHFTWRQRPAAVAALLPDLEAALLPLGARPHWGKCFAGTDLASRYPRWSDFGELRRAVDPTGKFDNPFLSRLFGTFG